MEHGGRVNAHDIESAFRRIVETYPGAGVAAVRSNGLFCPLPAEAGVDAARALQARAGIELVAPESRAVVLDQFRQIEELGASEIEVRLASGKRGRYALFDTRAQLGVVMLVVVEGEPDGWEPLPQATDVAPVRPRYGRVKRTETGAFLDADDELLALLGYSKAEFAALGTDAVHEHDYPALVGQWFDLLKAPPGSSRRVRVRYRRSGGEWVWVELTITRLTDAGGNAYMMLEFLDISEEMAAMDEVWKSRELLRRLTEALPIGVLQIDSEANVVYANDRLHRIVGVPRAETLAAQLSSIASEDAPLLDAAVREVLATGADVDRELRFATEGIRYAKLSVRALRDRAESVTGAIICISDVTDSTRMRQELEQRASSDVLTGCCNRAAVMTQIGDAVAASRLGTAVVFVDLDGFKPINDRLGHAAGDRLLKIVARRLQGVVRTGDVVGRLGGDEFLVLCPDVVSRALALEIGERITRAVQFDATVDGEPVPLRASVGVAWTDQSDIAAESLVAEADAAMYQAKRAGGQRAAMA